MSSQRLYKPNETIVNQRKISAKVKNKFSREPTAEEALIKRVTELENSERLYLDHIQEMKDTIVSLKSSIREEGADIPDAVSELRRSNSKLSELLLNARSDSVDQLSLLTKEKKDSAFWKQYAIKLEGAIQKEDRS